MQKRERRRLRNVRNEAAQDRLPDGVYELDGYFSVRCRSCDKLYELPCELGEFDSDMSYCGGSPRCCP